MAQEFWDSVEGRATQSEMPAVPVVSEPVAKQPATKQTAPGKPVPSKVDTGSLVADVTQAYQGMDKPKPTAVDPIQSWYDTIANNWQTYAKVAGGAAAGYGLYKAGKRMVGGEKAEAPRVEPTMDGLPKTGRVEPVFNEPVPTPETSKPTLTEAERHYGVQAKTPQERSILENSYKVFLEKQNQVMNPLPGSVAPQPMVPAPQPVVPQAAPMPTAVAPAAVAPSATPMAPETVPAAPPAEKKARVPKAPVEQKAVLAGLPEQTPIGYYKGAVPPEVLARYEGMTGPGGNHVYNILGPEKYQDFLKKYHHGKGPADYKAALALWEKHGPEYLQSFGPSTTKEIRKERGMPPPNMGNFGKVGESGAATLPAMLNLAGNALGAVGLAKAYEHGTKTGDYSDFGLGVIGQLLANTVPKAATPFSLMAPGGLNANEQAELARRRGMAPTID